MADQKHATTPPAMNSGEPESPEPRRLKWISIYDEYPRSLPVDWICPVCDLPLGGFLSCQKCGLTIMHDKAGILDGPQHIAHTRDDKRWRKFAKGGRS